MWQKHVGALNNKYKGLPLVGNEFECIHAHTHTHTHTHNESQ